MKKDTIVSATHLVYKCEVTTRNKYLFYDYITISVLAVVKTNSCGKSLIKLSPKKEFIVPKMRLGDLQNILQTFVNTHCTQFMINLTIVNRPNVAGAVIQTVSCLTTSLVNR